jgi:hypothetical protein
LVGGFFTVRISRVALLVVLVLSLLGCLLGAIAAGKLYRGKFRGWQNLGTPLGSAQAILDANASFAYVETTTVDITSCPPCEGNVQPLDEPLLDEQFDCSPSLGPPPAPGEVVDRFAGVECYADGSTDFEYVILSDGSVWRWDFTSSAYLVLVYPILMVVGCLVGSLIGGAITLGIWLFSKRF